MRWFDLERLARREVDALKRKLPPEMEAHARAVPVVMMRRPTRQMADEDGIEPDLLGLFVGPSRLEEWEGGDPLPAEILLFLEKLW